MQIPSFQTQLYFTGETKRGYGFILSVNKRVHAHMLCHSKQVTHLVEVSHW